jgi:hypothetical protein
VRSAPFFLLLLSQTSEMSISSLPYSQNYLYFF